MSLIAGYVDSVKFGIVLSDFCAAPNSIGGKEKLVPRLDTGPFLFPFFKNQYFDF